MRNRPGVKTPRLFRIFGMQRSGNHAIIAWLRANLGAERNLFLNNCGLRSPLDSFAQIEIAGQERRPAKFRRQAQFKTLVGDVRDYASVIVSYENKRSRQIKQRCDFTAFGRGTWRDIYVLRSFHNWLASYVLMRSTMSGGTSGEVNSLGMYAAIAQLPTYRELLKSAQNEGAVTVCYDDWVISPDYREACLSALEIPVTQNDIGARTVYGQGSSFEDAQDAIDTASQISRWQRLADHSMFQACLTVAAQDKGLLAQIERVFPSDHQLLLQRQVQRAGAA